MWWSASDRGICQLPRQLQDAGIKISHFGLARVTPAWKGMLHNTDYACYLPTRWVVVPAPAFALLFWVGCRRTRGAGVTQLDLL